MSSASTRARLRPSADAALRPADAAASSTPAALRPADAAAKLILERFTTWAVVGCSPDPQRDSHGVARFLQERAGKRVIPVNPHACPWEILGQTCHPDLRSVEEPIEVVDIFRRSEHVREHVDEAIAVGAQAVWMQLGVVDREAAALARAAGLLVVMDRCPRIDWPRLVEGG